MNALETNKQEIEKLMKEMNEDKDYSFDLHKAVLEERIKTSILFCEDEIEFLEWCLESLGHDIDSELLNPTAFHINKRKEELTAHLEWLKQKQQDF